MKNLSTTVLRWMLLIYLGVSAGDKAFAIQVPDVSAHYSSSLPLISDIGTPCQVGVFEEEGRRSSQRYSRRHITSSFRRTANNTQQEEQKTVFQAGLYIGQNPEIVCAAPVLALSTCCVSIFCPTLHSCYTALYLRHLF